MDYTVFHGLEFNPFIKNSKPFLLETHDYKEATNRLIRLEKLNGFGLITGSPGKGKTTIVRNWCNSLNPSLYKVVYTCLSTLTVNDFYRHLASLLGLEPAYKKPLNYDNIRGEINRLTLDKKKTPVIIIDEANHISNSILTDMPMLFNFDMDLKDRAIVLLVGLPKLIRTLELNANEALSQRIVVNYQINGISKNEVSSYINTALKGAGIFEELFAPAAIEAIANAADGAPRIINKICTNCLIISAAKQSHAINPEIVDLAISESELE